jgi:hypothetical protein
MNRSMLVFAFSAIAATAASGCTAQTGEETGSTSSPLVVLTTCTGPAISAAVAAGGEVDLACNPGPPIPFNSTIFVNKNAVLRNISPNPVTFLQMGDLFEVGSRVSFEMDGVTLLGFGASSGTAVHGVGSTITLQNDQFSNFPAFVVSVHAFSTLTVNGCTFTSNVSNSSSFAGSIYLEGSTGLVTSSTFQGNSSLANGGAIVDFGNLTVIGSNFLNNSAQLGGGIYAGIAAAVLQVRGSRFTGNIAPSGGGAIFYAGTTQAVVSGSVISNNSNPQIVGNVLVLP